MSERHQKGIPAEAVPERRGMESLQEPLLSEEMATLVETAHTISPEELKARLTDMVDKVAELEKKSRVDDLTGLLNRRGFREEWDRYASMLKREHHKGVFIPSAFLAVDLDGFKMINDTVGHDGGDRFLQLVAEKTQPILRKGDVIGRIGGDEFAVFLFDATADGAKEVASNLRAAIEDINGIMREEYAQYRANASASIGIVTIDGEGHIGDDQYTTLEQHPTMGEIKNYADYALYVAKEQGKQREFSLKEAWEADPERVLEKAFLNR